VLAAGFLALAAIVWSGTQRTSETGITTEVALLVMFVVGAAVAQGQQLAAVAVSGAVAVLLHWKQPLHAFVRRVGEDDARSVMQLVLVGLVILPALPDRSFGPYQVLNPFQIGSMVVLIVGLSLGAYVAQRLAGAKAGTLVAGVLGGLISSTATTVSYARRTRDGPKRAPATALVLALSSTVVLPRVLLLAAIVAPGVVASLAPPHVAMFAGMLGLSALIYYLARSELASSAVDHAPSDLRTAVVFGLLYAAVLLAVAFAQHRLGAAGLYTVATLSGLTDVDAIALSTVQHVRAGGLEIEVGWRMILAGVMANLVFKGAIVLSFGHPRLRRWAAALFGAAFLFGCAILLLWPTGQR
jgi:uncharacterized membrane protein (DUF4010 family)